MARDCPTHKHWRVFFGTRTSSNMNWSSLLSNFIYSSVYILKYPEHWSTVNLNAGMDPHRNEYSAVLLPATLPEVGCLAAARMCNTKTVVLQLLRFGIGHSICVGFWFWFWFRFWIGMARRRYLYGNVRRPHWVGLWIYMNLLQVRYCRCAGTE